MDNISNIILALPIWSQEIIKTRMGQDNYLENIALLSVSKYGYLKSIIANIAIGIPISKILGIKYFYQGVFLNANVLDPRYDSEVIVDICYYIMPLLQNSKKPIKILELGGGSGCLSLTALDIIPNSQVWIVEKSREAIKTLKRNIKKNNFINQCQILEGSWWEPIEGEEEGYSILLFNPPYLSLQDMVNHPNPSGTQWDPTMALYGGFDGLQDYQAVIPEIKKYITHFAIIEICSEKIEKIISIIKVYDLQILKIFPDIQGRPRMILLDLRTAEIIK
jgi:release factor glutamine methyltransferase